MSFTIRPARPDDEAAFYDICLKTGDAGQDATDQFADPRALANVYVGPYLRLQPEFAFALEDGEGVCGYVLGALDSVGFYRRLEAEWWPALRARHPAPAGDPAGWSRDERCYRAFHHPSTFVPPQVARYPAHLHIDLLPRAQGQGLGRRLLETLFLALRARGAPGVHLEVGLTNARAVAFYRKVGFMELARHGDVLCLGLGLAALDRYHTAVTTQLEDVLRTQRLAIETAGRWVADALAQGGTLWTAGTGHSHLLALEPFYRAGGLAKVAPLLDEALMLHESASASSALEREPGRAAEIAGRYPLRSGDVLLVVSSSGRNAVPIELALLARERGLRTIGLVSRRHAEAAPARHPAGRLGDVVDLALDTCGVVGDAAVTLPGLAQAVGPTSTITGAFVVNAVAVHAAEALLARGITPEVYASANAPGGEAHNAALVGRHRGALPHL